MLRNLLKYELKATARLFLPIYLVMTALAVVTGLLAALGSQVSSIKLRDAVQVCSGIFGVLFGVCCVVLPFVTIYLCMRRFYDNLFKREGYLMHTLPVTPAQLILSKAIAGLLWMAASSVLVALLSSLLVAGSSTFQFLFSGFQFLWQDFSDGGMTVAMLFVAIVSGLGMNLCFLLLLYAALSVASLRPKHHRLIGVGMIIAFCVLHVVTLVLFLFGMSDPVFQFTVSNFFRGPGAPLIATETAAYWTILWTFFAAVMIYLAAFCVLYFVITRCILKNHLNLE